jgi:hypothetical protein
VKGCLDVGSRMSAERDGVICEKMAEDDGKVESESSSYDGSQDN